MEVLEQDMEGVVVFECFCRGTAYQPKVYSVYSIVQQDYLGLRGVSYWLLAMFSSWLGMTNRSTSYLDLVLFLANINQLPKAENIL